MGARLDKITCEARALAAGATTRGSRPQSNEAGVPWDDASGSYGLVGGVALTKADLGVLWLSERGRERERARERERERERAREREREREDRGRF